jgi:hypothetical protein
VRREDLRKGEVLLALVQADGDCSTISIVVRSWKSEKSNLRPDFCVTSFGIVGCCLGEAALESQRSVKD